LFHRVKKLASQFFSALCEARESSEEQRIGISHAVSADIINDVETELFSE